MSHTIQNTTPTYKLGEPVEMPDFTVLWSGIFHGQMTLQFSIPHVNEICECGADHLTEDGMQTVHFAIFDEHALSFSGQMLLKVPCVDTFVKYKEDILAAAERQYQMATVSVELTNAVAVAAVEAELDQYKAAGGKVN